MEIFDGVNEFTTTLKKVLYEIDTDYMQYDGLIVPGSHRPSLIEEKIGRIREARETGRPALLICLGYQLGAIEHARNVLGIKDATSEEFGEGTWVVKKREDGLKVGEHDGETWWSNYEVTIDWEPPKNFYATPSHPEYQHTKGSRQPLLLHFIQLCRQESRQALEN